MNELTEQLPIIKGIYRERFELHKEDSAQGFDRSFNSIAAHFAHDEGTVLLLSGSGNDCAQYHILAAKPWLHIKNRVQNQLQSRGKSGRVKLFAATNSDKTIYQEIYPEQDALALIRDILNQCRLPDYSFNSSSFPSSVDNSADLPVSAGLFGYFSYDLKDGIETLPRTCMESGLPDICLYAPSFILIQEIKTGAITLQIPVLSSSKINPDEWIRKTKDYFYDKLKIPAASQICKRVSKQTINQVSGQSISRAFSTDSSGLKSSFTKSEYIHAVKKIINHLKAGDIYQANLSQRFETGFKGDSYSFFQELYQRNPASFFAYINAGDHHVVSTSPERFIKQEGRAVETRPIKGTIARGKDNTQDLKNKKHLQNSIKDDAELTMIVDLMRNDISRVCCYDTVIVSEHKRIEAYENVYHLVSVIKGELQKDKDSIDLIKATFPGGSITGCPKIRSMEIIDELEPVQRHVYTGSIGYISFHDTMDLSIAIRTAVITKGRIYFSVGGGIVYDSDPEKEYQETLDKGKTLMETLKAGSDSQASTSGQLNPRSQVWVNGKVTEQDKAAISISEPGFQYGAGIFETIKADKGRIFRLKEHLSRMNKSWQKLFSQTPPDINWENIIQILLRENRLLEKQAAIKLVISKRDSKQEAGQGIKTDPQPFLAAFAREYNPRSAIMKKSGLDLITYPHLRQTPIADHKSLNYLYYYLAGQYAMQNKADEALILNPDNTVSESNTANILAINGKTAIIPKSKHCLPGVTLKVVLNFLARQGYDIQEKKISVQELAQYPEIILTNALMGAVKVLSIDGIKIKGQGRNIDAVINNELWWIRVIP